jgi:hypothetical protein
MLFKFVFSEIKTGAQDFRNNEAGRPNMSERLLFNANSAICQLNVYHDENKLIFNEMMMIFTLY